MVSFGRFFYSISIRRKASILIFITAFGIISVGLISSFMIFGMKNSIDRLFIQRTYSLAKLQNIKDLYNQNIYYIYRDVIDNKYIYKDKKEGIYLAHIMIKNKWQEYNQKINAYNGEINFFYKIEQMISRIFLAKDYDTNIEKDKILFEKISNKIDTLAKMIDKIDILFLNNKNDEAISCIKDKLYPLINNINVYIGNLINYHLQTAINEKEDSDILFIATFWIIFFIIFVVLVASVILVHFILKYIQRINSSLERKVLLKTKELHKINNTLEARIKKEIETSRLKDEMIHQQSKLASMGEMLANIAHQWRQPLNALNMLIQTFEIKNMNNKLTKEFVTSQVEEGVKIANSMSETIDEFRNYFQPEKQKENFLISDCIEKGLFLVDGVLKKEGINIVYNGIDKLIINGYPNSFIQVFVNILSNAKDAQCMNKVPKKYIDIESYKENNFAIIEIIDNGGGIKDDIKNRIFEPYFTTKHQSSGTGIGLYMSKNIIEKNFNGTIEVENIIYNFDKDYKCSKFKIRLPLINNP